MAGKAAIDFVAKLAEKGFRVVRNQFNDDEPDVAEFVLLTKNDDQAGRITTDVAETDGNALNSLDTEIAPSFRRQGLASDFYSAVEEITGKKLKPSPFLSEDGVRFWISRNRAYLEDMVENDAFYDDDNLEKVRKVLAEDGAKIIRGAVAPAAVGAGLLASPEEAEAGILTASLSPVLRDSLTKYLKGEEITKGNRNKVEKYLATVATDQTAYGRRERMRMQPGASPDVEVDITREIITPESMQGEILVPIMGDASIAGGYLDNAEGVPLDQAVRLQGGPNYSLMNAYRTQDPLGWASMLSAAQAKQDQITRAGLLGDVRGVYSRMGDEAMKFNTMVAEAMVRQLPALQLPKKDIARFNKDIRGTVPDFAGVETAEGLAQLKGQLPAAQKSGKSISPSDLRKLVVSRMSLKREYGDYGFPSYEDTIRAITEPGLRDAVRGDSGFATIQGMPGFSLLDNAYHDTYSHGIPGRYAGGLEENIPLEIMFPDMFADTANKVVTKETSARFGQPLNPQERVGAVLMGGGNQAANQKWLDGVMKYLEDKKKLGRAGAIAAATASGNAMAIPPEDLDLQGEKDRRRAGGRKYRRDNRPSKQLQEYAQGQIAPAIAEAAMGAGKGLLGTVDMVTQAMAAPSPEAARVNPEAFQRQMQQYMESQSLPNQQNPNSIFSTQPMRSLLDQQIMEDAAERENVRRFGETIGGLLAPI